MHARTRVIVPIGLSGMATAACSPEPDKAHQPEQSDRLESPDPAEPAVEDSGDPEPEDTGGDDEDEPEDLDGDGSPSGVDCDGTSADVHPLAVGGPTSACWPRSTRVQRTPRRPSDRS